MARTDASKLFHAGAGKKPGIINEKQIID